MGINSKKKRVLIVSPADSFFTMPHVRAFEALDFECETFDNRSTKFYSSPLLRRLMRVFPQLRIVRKIALDQTNKKLISLVSKYKPFFVFSVKAENIYPETIKTINNMGVITACFYIDLMDHWSLISKLAPAYNYFFSQDTVILDKLRSELGLRNCFYMTFAADANPNPFNHREDKYDVSFVGQYNKELYPNREKYLIAIKDLGLSIWGTDNWLKTSLKDCFRGHSIGNQRLDIYRSSKIVIDINWNIMPANGLSNRPVEVGASGACLFSDLVRSDIHNILVQGKEFVSFNNEEDLREKVIYYLNNNEERKKIALAGYRRVLHDHSYANRIKQMLDVILSHVPIDSIG